MRRRIIRPPTTPELSVGLPTAIRIRSVKER